jgi:2'-5' RNA ligase
VRPNWFVALPIPAEAWFAERVAPHAPAGVRLFHPQDVHLTVAFLGGVSEESAGRAWALAALWRQGPVRATLGEVVGMGPPRRFSALSALIEDGCGEIEAGLRACRDSMLAAAGVPPERRPVHAHVTLARPRRDARPEERSAALAWAMRLPLRSTPIAIAELALYTWAEDRRERQFRVVARCPLASADSEEEADAGDR